MRKKAGQPLAVLRNVSERTREGAMGNGLIRAVAAMLGASIFMLAETALSDEIRVMSSNAFRQAYLELVPKFEKASGHKVVTSFVGSADIMKRMKAGESVDLVILAASSVDELIQLGKVVPASRVDLAKSGVGAAVRAGTPKPDISSSFFPSRASTLSDRCHRMFSKSPCSRPASTSAQGSLARPRHWSNS